jgi:two-component system chemotaxis response regulator CheB
MPNVRILVVDDAPLYRHVVRELFTQSPGFDVVGCAENGREALTLIHLQHPDLVVLDIEMPVMDGWQTLRAIQFSHPQLKVILFSSIAADASESRAKAQELGAIDFVAKPMNVSNHELAWKELRETLLPTVKTHVGM